MKFLVLIALSAVAVTGYVIPAGERINGENGWYVPKVDGSFVWMNMDDAKNNSDRKAVIEGRFSTNPVTFYLYTRDNPKKPQVISASPKSIEASNFDGQKPTRISIHGWNSGERDFINFGVRGAWLDKLDCNFIFVSWSRAHSIEYASSTYAVAGVGKQVAVLLDFLVAKYGLNLDNLEVIGHSLGAHVAGFIGKNIKSGRIRTIIGLDPALPLFTYANPHQRLSSTDANYVETIQTNGNQLGFLKPIGVGAFYPNGGKAQPGCKYDLTGSCSHSRSIQYYVEAIRMNNFPSYKCESYKDAVAQKCGFAFSSVRMAAAANAFYASGEFYVPVKNSSPYGMLE